MTAASVLGLGLAGQAGANEGDGQARILPERVSVSGSLRLRHETLSAPYRAGRDGSDQQASWRLRILGEFDAGAVTFGAELLDARTWLNDEGSVLAVNTVNAAELFQAYARVSTGDASSVQIGRMIMTVGSGRLIAHNNFANSPNNFEGVRWRQKFNDDWSLDSFYGAPVRIAPRDRQAILNNTAQIDQAEWGTRLWAGHLTRKLAPGRGHLEGYVIGLNHQNGTDTYTAGLRLLRAPSAGAWDHDLEGALQFGSRPVAGGRQDIRAGFTHLEAGYTFQDAWRTRLSAQLTYATGDKAGGDFGRFNSIFGGRRGDFGPTGIFGPVGRDNVVAGGVRYQARTGPVQLQARVLETRLAQTEDRWGRANLADATGQSGRRIGIVSDMSVGYNLPNLTNTRLEAGLGHIAKGRFARTAPNAPDSRDVVYSFVMLNRSF
ncbi:alginate export family protein [Alkalicaulis satelles]|nr:alginate export family protein [Alkalicaulis satelles]